MNGVAMMNPFAMRIIIKNGISAPIFVAPAGTPSSVIRADATPVIVAKTPAIMTG